MSYLERKTGRGSQINSLPNYTAAGSYCFFSQCIELNDLDEKDLLAFTDNSKSIDENHRAILKFGPLLNHEVKHWYDAHSTLWGLRFLSDIYHCRNDLHEAEQSGIATELPHFYRQLEIFDRVQYIKFPQYYSTANPNANTSAPWKYRYSAGIMFSKYGKPTDRNLFFTRFENNKGELIARVPFSLCALLESSAVAQEINAKSRIISMIEDPISSKIEKDKLLKDTMADLYDENLVEYSVVAHKISNSFSISDAIEAYNIAAKLTRLILNLPSDVITSLKPKEMLNENFEPFYTPYENALKYIDYGAIFSLLVDSLYSEFQIKGIKVTSSNLESLLAEIFEKNLNLTLAELFDRSKKEIKKICSSVNFNLDKDHVDALLEVGVKLHSDLGLIGSHFINLDENLIPDFVLGDGFFVSQKGGSQENFEKRYFELTGYLAYLSNFSKACIV
ncbi:hypothetical protein Q4561_16145 [Alteromonas sp. 1_MG-2023]|uniref:hypothetical protein n=1 Tax=Alteromonas sp. 1_MG-2023 TaxID=3062669 RepID=UPI0026E2C329|nr:hypothetical protein [Alteromonas sp. 1_MG-2023]MDO6568604.1 hypothetical protein [Alteromonas sp. 1_MG-2023]